MLKGVLGPDASDADAEASDEASKLDLNRDDQDGVEGAVTMDLAPGGSLNRNHHRGRFSHTRDKEKYHPPAPQKNLYTHE